MSGWCGTTSWPNGCATTPLRNGPISSGFFRIRRLVGGNIAAVQWGDGLAVAEAPHGRIAQAQAWGMEAICARTAVAAATSQRRRGTPESAGRQAQKKPQALCTRGTG